MPATGQADNTIKFSFDSPNAPIPEADLRAAVDTPENADYEAPVQDKPQAAAPVAATTPAEVTPASDTDPIPSSEEVKTYTVKVNGVEKVVTETDLKAGYMMHSDYTQKTQALAAKQAELDARDAQRTADLQAIDGFLKDRNAVVNYAKQVFGIDLDVKPVAVPQLENPQNPTLKDIAAISAYNTEQARVALAKEFEEKLQAERTKNEDSLRQSQANLARRENEVAVNAHIAGILKQYPLLAKFEDIADDLMGDASKRLPQNATIEDAKAQLTAAAERRMAVMQSLVTEDKKVAAVQAAKLKQSSPEPPGGSPAKAPAGRRPSLNTSVQSQKDFIADSVAMLEAFQAANN